MFKDYYSILNIHSSATDSEIKSARNRLAKKWHPDLNPNTDVTELMQDINEAYLILSDQEARIKYNEEYSSFKRYEDLAKPVNNQPNTFNQKETEYQIKDEILLRWITNARKQAIEIYKTTIRDSKGVAKAAGNGFIDGLKNAFIFALLIGLIFLITRMFD